MHVLLVRQHRPAVNANVLELPAGLVDPGDRVYEGDRVVEVLSNGATFDVSSPVTGRFIEKKAQPDDPLVPGQWLGMVEVDDADS